MMNGRGGVLAHQGIHTAPCNPAEPFATRSVALKIEADEVDKR